MYTELGLNLCTMAVPPSYSDLGKSARDLFTKGFSEYLTSCIAKLIIGSIMYNYNVTTISQYSTFIILLISKFFW